jgi:two-component system cell cycle sensor histidine kinase/response regulator CckA
MPGMTGPSLVAELTKRHPDLTAVFISGHGESEAVRLGLAPDSRWLQKPFSPADLLHEIERVLAPA